MFSEKDKNYMGEMFEQQTKTLIEHVDTVSEDLRKEIRAVSTKVDDTKADIWVETDKRIDKKIQDHVVTSHA